MSIVLVRHGETRLNAARVIQPADTPLGERGRQQADAVARRFADARPAPAGILSSDLPRAFETATAIAAALGGIDVQLSELLQERNFGALRGRSYDELGYDPLTVTDTPQGGESVAAFEQRVAAAFEEVRALRAQLAGDLIVVSHGLFIRRLLERHVSFPAGTAPPERLGNTSVTVLSASAPHQVLKLGCTAHLDQALDDDGRSLAGF